MGPFGPCDSAFDRHIDDLTVVLSPLYLVLEIQIGAYGDCVDSSKG
jgi:hypothetical protein